MQTLPQLSKRVAHALVLGAAVLLVSGCVSSKKYRLAHKDTPPARPLGWTTAAEPVELTLVSVVVFKGPGSWKREARWDEYEVRIANRSAGAVTIEEAVLYDVIDQGQLPGTDPWALEKLSRTNWDKYGKTGLKVMAGAGAVALYGAAVVGSATGALLSGGAVAGGATALNVVPVLAIANVAVVAVINSNNKKKVRDEFDRRRLSLPLTVAAGESRQGSFFFPMTPGPQMLCLRGQNGAQSVELVIDLKPLGGLHLKPATP